MHSMLASIFYWFLTEFSSQLRPLDLQKTCFSKGKTMFFQKSASEVDIDFWSEFGSNLVPFWFPRSTKLWSKIDLKKHQKIGRFENRFFRDLGVNLAPTWTQHDAQDGPNSDKSGLLAQKNPWVRLPSKKGVGLIVFRAKKGCRTHSFPRQKRGSDSRFFAEKSHRSMYWSKKKL